MFDSKDIISALNGIIFIWIVVSSFLISALFINLYPAIAFPIIVTLIGAAWGYLFLPR